MDHGQLKQALKDLPLGAIRYYDTIGSTNREAINWVEKDAPDLAIVIADEQTEGYGRKGRKWYTAKGDALAISLVLRPLFSEGSAAGPKSKDSSQIASLTALGALAVTETLRGDYNLDAKIKWPNDVLVNGYKLAGILAEAVWLGEILAAAVIGIGVNVR